MPFIDNMRRIITSFSQPNVPNPRNVNTALTTCWMTQSYDEWVPSFQMNCKRVVCVCVCGLATIFPNTERCLLCALLYYIFVHEQMGCSYSTIIYSYPTDLSFEWLYYGLSVAIAFQRSGQCNQEMGTIMMLLRTTNPPGIDHSQSPSFHILHHKQPFFPPCHLILILQSVF